MLSHGAAMLLYLTCNSWKTSWLKMKCRDLLLNQNLHWCYEICYCALCHHAQNGEQMATIKEKNREDYSTVSSKYCLLLTGERTILSNVKLLWSWNGMIFLSPRRCEVVLFLSKWALLSWQYGCVCASFQDDEGNLINYIRLLFFPFPPFLLGWFISVTSEHTSKVQKTLQATDQTGT